jgi:serine/threonine-protein kinase RsbW
MGVFFMRSLMDECSFHNLGPGGKETHLIKYLGSQARAEQSVAEAHAAEAGPGVIKEKIQYYVRPMREDEAIEVSKGAFKSHGYSFFDDHIYYPERLVNLIRSGDMISVVAMTKDEVFMGHACMLFQYPEDRCAELTFVFVNPEFRGQGALAPYRRSLSEGGPSKAFMRMLWQTTPLLKRAPRGRASTIAASCSRRAPQAGNSRVFRETRASASAWFWPSATLAHGRS